MSYKPKTIRRSPAQIRNYMRCYNDLAKGLRALRKLIDQEVKLVKERQSKVKSTKAQIEEAEELFR